MNDQRFPPSHRVRRSAEYDQVFRRKCRASDEVLLVYGLPSAHPHSRLGMAVSRKVGNSVVRHRWKRLIRESFRLSRANLPEGIDLVVIPRQGIEPELRRVERSLVALAWQVARRLRKDSGR